MSLLWINGQLVDKSEARVSVFDHGFLYGDGVWEHFRVFGGKLFRPEFGIRSLLKNLQFIGMELPLSEPSLLDAIELTVSANNREKGYVRVLISRGTGTLGPDPRKTVPLVIIFAEEYQPFPLELQEHGLDVVVHCTLLAAHNWNFAHKFLGQPHIVTAKREALMHGCLEAVCCDLWGCILGATEGSLFRVQQRRPIHQLDFVGQQDATVEFVNEVADVSPFNYGPERQTPASILHDSVELFLAGTTCGIIAIVKVDGKPIGSGTEGPITRRIREAYHRLTHGAE